jgi:hypothetical protein
MPDVLVTFYSNFRFEPVDISGVFAGIFGVGTGSKLAHVHQTINQAFPNPAHPPEEPPCLSEVVEEKEFDETMTTHYANSKIKVIASGGTWKLKVEIGATVIESSAIPYNASAAEITAALPAPFRDPAAINIDRITKLAGGGGCGGGGQEEAAPLVWIQVLDVAPGEWEFRYFDFAGTKNPSGLSVQSIDIDLGEVIEMQPKHDEKQYVVPLEEGCTGIGPPPHGKTEIGGSRAGVRDKPEPVVGRAAGSAPRPR